ncbi:NADH-quinone oxidoreductase subunit N [uncultured Flavobacterium sp.]|uniref:NADH-quinone oxidoreductase subunit N n=1 Tax=uncultured Flavobacterium sp. TaxID=165435 RepID=UPI0025FAA78E|nr:NADH-quinone oxidoreductase subunit N [uncultured Flavobacterium sp.]
MNTLIAIAGLGIICLIAEIFNLRKAIVPITLVGLLGVLGLTAVDYMNLMQAPSGEMAKGFYNNMIVINRFSLGFTGLFTVLAIFLIALSPDFHRDHKPKISDFVAIKLFLLLGAVAMVSFGNLSMFFLGIEILSISLYVLAASEPKNLKSNEAGMKYFLMGAFASGIILFGIALIYGATGSFDTAEIYKTVVNGNLADIKMENISDLFLIGLVMLTIGLLFKMAIVPFHFWSPDVYEGSPALSTATMSTLAKVASIAAFFKLVLSMTDQLPGHYMSIITIVIVLSMTVGNLMALKQDNVKRMLAFSGISHAGFMLMVLYNPIATAGTLYYYAAAYSLTGIAAFAVVLYVCQSKGNENIYNFNGLGKSHPMMAGILTCALLSMAGIPVFSGFFAKLFLFSEVLRTGHIAIVIIAIINSIISVGYYFKLILAMYTKEETEKREPLPFMYGAVALISLLLSIAMGLNPSMITILVK